MTAKKADWTIPEAFKSPKDVFRELLITDYMESKDIVETKYCLKLLAHTSYIFGKNEE